MACDCCCKKTLKLCKVSICGGELDFGITALVAGIHKLVVEFLGTQLTFEETFEVSDQIIFTITGLNEGFTFSSKLYDPDDKQILISKNDIEYDCFSFQTVLNITLTHADVVES